MRENYMSPCGVDCSACESYPTDCDGCRGVEGDVFWLGYTDEKICPIYQCCVNEKKLEHCGSCYKLPCAFYDRNDPTKSEEENREILKRQLRNLSWHRKNL